MSELLEEIEEIIDYAKGNSFPTTNLLRHALVVAKKVDDKNFEEFIINELKGYKSGGVPRHRRVRGRVVIPPPYGIYQPVDLDDLDAEAKLKVSTAYVAETVPVIENTINLLGDEGIFTVGFTHENEGVLPPPSRKAEYVILLVNAQLKELLDDVRMTVLSWAIELQRERTKEQANVVKAAEPPAAVASGSPVKFLSANKHWMFEGIGTEAVKAILTGVVVLLGVGGGGLWLWNRQADDGRSDRSESNSANTATASTPASGPTARIEAEGARPPARYTFEQLRTMLKGKSKEEVQQLLGNPFTSSDYGNGNGSWAYQNIAYDPLTGKVATVAVVSFTNGKVDEVAFG